MAFFEDIKGFFKFDADRKRDIRDQFNLLAAAETHVLWKTRLGHHVQGSVHEEVESTSVGQGGLCQLGSWINSADFEFFQSFPEYELLQEAHLKFHHAGDLIVEKLQAGHRGEAAVIFKGEYNQSLRRIIQALTNINQHLQES